MHKARLGVDIAQQVDFTALAATEIDQETKTFRLRSLGRLPKLSYVEIGERIVTAAKALHQRADGPVVVVMDATGVGRPVLDMIRQPLREANIATRGVVITAGDEIRTVERVEGGTMVRVGKTWLVSRLISLMQKDAIQGGATIPAMKDLQDELRNFQVTAKTTHDVYGAKSGTHDDLVIALALAVLDVIPQEAKGLADLNATLTPLAMDPERMGGVKIAGWHGW